MFHTLVLPKSSRSNTMEMDNVSKSKMVIAQDGVEERPSHVPVNQCGRKTA